MNQDKLEFYYQSKNLHSIQEKTASDKQQELEEKIAGNMRAVLSNFATKHPKATESAITGGILGAGSELVMPANKDMYGNPSTNLGEIGKRALLGATLGGIGGELKTQVRSHVIPKIAQEDFDKIAGKLDALKLFAHRNAATIGTGLGAGAMGAAGGYLPEQDISTGEKYTKGQRRSHALKGGLFGAATGALIGSRIDADLNGFPIGGRNPMKYKATAVEDLSNMVPPKNVPTKYEVEANNHWQRNIDKTLKDSPVLPKYTVMPSTVRKSPSRVVKPLQLPANASSSSKKKGLLGKLFSKEASKLDALKTFGQNHKNKIVGGLSHAAMGGLLTASVDKGNKKLTKNQKRNRIMLGTAIGGLGGAAMGHFPDTLKSYANKAKVNRTNTIKRTNIDSILKDSPVLPKDVVMPSNVKKVPSHVVKPLQLPANASSSSKKKGLLGKLFSKEASKLDALKTFGKRNAFTIGNTTVSGLSGAAGGYYNDKDVITNKKFTKKQRKVNAVVGGVLGAAIGGVMGRDYDKGLNKLRDAIKANNVTNQKLHNNTLRKGISNFLEHSPVLPKNINMPSDVKKVPSRVVKPLQLPANASSGLPKKKSLFGKLFSKEAGFIGRAGELLAGGRIGSTRIGGEVKYLRPGNHLSQYIKPQWRQDKTEALKSLATRGVAGVGLLGAGALASNAMSSNSNSQPQLQPQLKTAFALAPSSLLEGAGKLMAKSPRVGGAVIGGAAGLAGNALSGEDHALGSTLAGAAMGGLAGKKLLANNATRNPLFGKSFGSGVRNELKAGINAKQNLANSLKIPTKIDMSATEQAAARLKAPTPMSPQMAPRNAPINTNKVEPYAVNTKGPVAKLPTQQSEQLINEKAKSNMNQQVSQAYKPTRSSVPMPSNVAMGSRPQHVMNLRS